MYVCMYVAIASFVAHAARARGHTQRKDMPIHVHVPCQQLFQLHHVRICKRAYARGYAGGVTACVWCQRPVGARKRMDDGRERRRRQGVRGKRRLSLVLSLSLSRSLSRSLSLSVSPARLLALLPSIPPSLLSRSLARSLSLPPSPSSSTRAHRSHAPTLAAAARRCPALSPAHTEAHCLCAGGRGRRNFLSRLSGREEALRKRGGAGCTNEFRFH